MRPRRLIGALLIVVAAAGGWGGAALIWDTHVLPEGADYWQSIYLNKGSRPNVAALQSGAASGFTGNEHAEIVAIALERMGAGVFASSEVERMVTDLNASYFHPELADLGTFPAAAEKAGLEQRLLPPIPQFAGVPDFSHTLYDWVDKNSRCPPLPPDAPSRDECYTFMGWMGGINSSHFGRQAEAFYKHLHTISLAHAAQAKGLREKLERHPNEREAYRGMVEEAELLALASEAFALHFLADRWSAGHMWDRWGSPTYDNENALGYIRTLVVAAITGIIHGHESTTSFPDPMSSPASMLAGQVSLDTLTFTHWKNGTSNIRNGIGDHRLDDAFLDRFGANYAIYMKMDYPVAATEQVNNMLTCAMAGLSEVIHAFGTKQGGSGFGVHEVPITGFDNGFSDVPFDCWGAWATNESIWLGWDFPSIGDMASLATGLGRVYSAAQVAAAGMGREDLIDFTHRMKSQASLNPNGTSLATGGIGTLLGIGPGLDYLQIPDWTDGPVSGLPDRESAETRGRTKETIMGFFNCAYADKWCLSSSVVLNEARAKGDARSLATCRYLGNRLYRGTDTTYVGRNAEKRTVNGRFDGLPMLPVCAALEAEPTATDSLPIYLHPGYVSSPYRRDFQGYWPAVENWCARVPVVDLIEDPMYPNSGPAERSDEKIFKRRNNDLVAEVAGPASVTITGRELGDTPGKLRLRSSFYGDTITPNISSWADERISFELTEEHNLRIGYWGVEVVTSDGRASVGWFDLRIRADRPNVKDVRISQMGEMRVGRVAGTDEPLGPGYTTIDVEFSQSMDTTFSPRAHLLQPGGAEGPRSGVGVPELYSSQPMVSLSGSWVDESVWRASMTLPGGDAGNPWEGRHRLSVNARSKRGLFLDTDGGRQENQPDTATTLAFVPGPEPAPDTVQATAIELPKTVLTYPVFPRDFDASIGASGVWFSRTARPDGGVVGRWWHVVHDPSTKTFHAEACSHGDDEGGEHRVLDEFMNWMTIATWQEDATGFGVQFHGSYEPVRGIRLLWPDFFTLRGSLVDFEWMKGGGTDYSWQPVESNSTTWRRLVPTVDSARVEYVEGTRWHLQLWGDGLPVHSYTTPEFQYLVQFEDPAITLWGGPGKSTRTEMNVVLDIPADAPAGPRSGLILGRRFDQLLLITRDSINAPIVVFAGEDERPEATTEEDSDATSAEPRPPPWELRWESLRLERRTFAGRPDPWVVRSRYSERGQESHLLVERFPVSQVRNEDTGEVFFSINWGGGQVATDVTGEQSELGPLANESRSGEIPRDRIDAAVRAALTGG